MYILWQDARYALRTIARAPGFAAIAIATLGVGTGASTAVFSVANALPPRAAGHPVLLWLGAAAALLLLIACVNCSNLLIARAMLRRKEVAVRTAMGAGRLRVLRLMLTESVMLALLGGAAGVLLAWWAVDVLMSMAPPPLAGMGFSADGRVLGVTLAVSLTAGILFGLVAALDSAGSEGPELLNRLDDAAQRFQLFRGANLIAVGEVALALSLMIGAGMMVETLWRVPQGQNAPRVFEQMRFAAALLAAFATIALMLAVSGVYAVTCQTVGRRSREIGIRLALGAGQSEVTWMVAGQAMLLVGVGAGVGLLTGIFASRTLASLPYGGEASGPTALLAVSAILALVLLPAGYFPARAASRIEPGKALKSD